MQNWYGLKHPPLLFMSRGLNPRQIEAFRAVMQSGTVTAAAEVLHTTQPSVSRLLAQLARETRLTLFDHHQARLRPTPEAQALLAVVERHFEGMDAIALQIAAIRRSGAGSLRVGCTPALAQSVLPQVVHAFIAQRPEVHLKLDTASMTTLQAGLERGQHELVLTTQPVRHAGLDAEVLARRDMVAVLHPGHPLAARARLHVRDLQGQVLLTLNENDSTWQQLRRALQQHQVEPATVVETSYSSTVCLMAREGTGVGIVNPYVATVFGRELRALRLLPATPVEVVMAFAGQTGLSQAAREFAALVRRHFAALPAGRGAGEPPAAAPVAA